MLYPKIPLAQNIILLCQQKGIKNVIISPGSRNAPLTIGFTNNPFFKCYSIADERCAGFFALGIAQQNRFPTILVCTSGSAVLNYYPAIAEAFYSQIPLIIISADRPFDKIDIGDGQTIRQQNVFENHSLYNLNLSEKFTAENAQDILAAIDASAQLKGPVHINCPFEEPLYETVSAILPQVLPIVNAIPINNTIENTQILDYNPFAEIWNKAAKKLILVGENFPNTIDESLTNILANNSSVVVMTESISNWHHKKFVNNIDTIITPFTESDFIDFQPDILITFGGMVVSKRIKSFLRLYKPKHHWHIDKNRAYNTYNCLTHHFPVLPQYFFDNFLPLTSVITSNYNQKIQDLRASRFQKQLQYQAELPFSDFKAFEIVLGSLPKNTRLQLSNSSAIRYSQLFNIDPSIQIFCNRGTSGIDGSTSTAIGAAITTTQQTILITGDIGFLYDSNALWNNYIPQNFKIILLNNGGGGIFRILPGHQENDTFNTFFETSHCLTAEHLAKMYGFDYNIAYSTETLSNSLTSFYVGQKPAILEIFTPTKLNNEILLNFFKNLL